MIEEVITDLFAKADEAISQIDEKISRIAAAKFQVQNKMIEMQKKLELAESHYPNILAARALGEVDSAHVEQCRLRIATLRQSLSECTIALPALERRQNAAEGELRRVNRCRRKVETLQACTQQISSGDTSLKTIDIFKSYARSVGIPAEKVELSLQKPNKEEEDSDVPPTATATISEEIDKTKAENSSDSVAIMTPEDLRSELGKRGMSANQFAQLCNMNQSYISRILSGKKPISANLLSKARKIL